MSYPLCRFAASPKGDDALAARRRLLDVSGLGRALRELCFLYEEHALCS